MQIRNTARRWGAVQQGLHWTIVLLVLAQIGMGFYIGLAHGPPVDYIQNFWHASIGILIFGLMVARLVWRESNPVPALPADENLFLRRLAGFTHFMFYFLIVLDPAVGYVLSSFKQDHVTFFGLRLPLSFWKDRALGHQMERVHWDFGYAILACIVLHAAGALHHEFVRRDNVLRRMLPGAPMRPEREPPPA